MSWCGSERPTRGGSGPRLVIGYGNPQRRDDGLGPFVATALEARLGHRDRTRVLVPQQLGPDLIDELKEADLVIMVDAALALEEGRRWTRLEADPDRVPYLSHTCTPEYLLGLLGLVHQRFPEAWLVSIRGDDFGHGEGLSPGAGARTGRVIAEISDFLLSKED
ncbi:MAG: hydrogenase maturation protease [Thermodesulfobacteriota bacterium]